GAGRTIATDPYWQRRERHVGPGFDDSGAGSPARRNVRVAGADPWCRYLGPNLATASGAAHLGGCNGRGDDGGESAAVASLWHARQSDRIEFLLYICRAG